MATIAAFILKEHYPLVTKSQRLAESFYRAVEFYPPSV
jgi:hypothetical protein